MDFLLAPGPTHVPDRVLRAMNRPAVELSRPDFVATARSCFEDLRRVFRTSGRVFVYACNGHGAWEAAIVNTLSAGDRVLVPGTGHFSNGWGQMAQALGVEVEFLPTDWRRALDIGALEARLRGDRDRSIKAVLAVQTDTATGITSDIPAVRAALDAADHPALLLVDATASLGTVDLRMDDWRVDVTVSASQKGLMSPPGLGFTAVGERALALGRDAGMPRTYWNWYGRDVTESYRWFCGTAPEHLVWALRESLDMLLEEGLDAAFARHQRLADAVRAGVAQWARAGVVDFNAVVPAERSNSVTTVRLADGHDATAVRTLCSERFSVSLGGGLGDLGGKAFRIAHMGDVNEPTLLGGLGVVEAALDLLGIPHEKGAVSAAIASLNAGEHAVRAAAE